MPVGVGTDLGGGRSGSGTRVAGFERGGRDRFPVALDVRRHGTRSDRRRPVAGHTLSSGGRGGEERAGVTRKARFDDGARKGPSNGLLVVTPDGQAQVRHAAAGQVAGEILCRFGEAGLPARNTGPHRSSGEASLLFHLRPGQRQRHGVPPAGVEVGRDLQRVGGASPSTGAMWTRSAPCCESRMVSNRATASGLR